MQKKSSAPFVLLVLGLMAVFFGIIFMLQDHILVTINDQQQDYLRSEHPTLFLICPGVGFGLGVLFIAAAFFTQFGGILNIRSPLSLLDFKWLGRNPPKWAEHPWKILNIGAVIFSIWGGYISLSPDRLRNTNPDIIFCSVTLVTTALFSIFSAYYSVNYKDCETLRRPSLDRNSVNWWYDPLQSLFMSTLIMAGTGIGSIFRFPEWGSTGFWTLGFYWCTVAGFMIGQFFVYKIYRERITQI